MNYRPRDRSAIRSRGGGGTRSLLLSALFADLGSGVVDTTLTSGSGSSTFTRATVAWTKLASGLWAQVASGSARSCYLGADTTVGTYGGLLIEAIGTQLVTPTASIRDMTDASWVKTTMTTALTSTGIDGATNSCTRVTAAGANSLILQTLVAAASSRTYSCWIKRVTGTGNVELTQDGLTFTDIKAQINSSTFTRVSLTASQLNASFGVRVVTNADAIDVDFNQFEAKAFPTSPMASAGAARNSDLLIYPTAGNIINAKGTVYMEITTAPTAVGQWLACGAANTSIPIGEQTATAAIFDGTAWRTGAAFTASATSVQKVASTWNSTTGITAVAGTATATAANDGDLGITGNFSVGSGTTAGTAPIYGTVKNLKIYSTPSTSAQLVALTT